MTTLAARALDIDLGGRAVLRGVDFAAEGGRMVGLIGPNGAGKTTLLRALAGLLEPRGGAVEIDGRALQADRRATARRLAYLAQNAPVHWPLTVERVVALGRLPHQAPWRRPLPADAAAIAEAMARTDVAALADRPVTTLSGGERMRVLLARALAGAPRVLLADEPVAALDPYHQLRVMELLRAVAAGGGAVVVVLHDLGLAARFCDRLVLLDGGRVAAEGAPEAVLTADILAAVYRIDAVLGRAGGLPYVLAGGHRGPGAEDRS